MRTALQAPEIQVVYSGIDWITVTLPKEAKQAANWLNSGYKLIEYISSEGNEMGQSGRLGYRGIQSGGSFAGARDDDYMIMISGHYAHEAFRVLYRPDAHFSRIDMQVTVKWDRLPINTAKKGYKDANAANVLLPESRRREVRLIVGNDNNDTLYVGSAKSEQRGCLYNKEAQSEDTTYAGAWRYECRFKNKQATAIAAQYASFGDKAVAWASDIVALWWESRGVEAPWAHDEEATPIAPPRSVPSDVESKLAWLRRQVAPALQTLLKLTDYATVIAALGLADGTLHNALTGEIYEEPPRELSRNE